MSVQYVMSHLETYPGMTSAISLQESEAGAWPSNSQDTRISGVGQEAARAPASPLRGRDLALRTLVEGSGRNSTASSGSAALQSSLESRLKTQLSSDGSTVFKLTWKRKVTPSGRRYCLLRASGHRTSAIGSSGGQGSWVTPNARDWKDSANPLVVSRRMASGRQLSVSDQVILAFGTMPSGSPALTGNAAPSRLIPRFSLWLMGYPTGWASCGERATPSSRRLRRSS